MFSRLVAIPRSSSVPMRGHGGPTGGHERRPRGNEYNQFLLRSPSNGNNFIMQSTHSTTTRPMITRQDFFQPQSILSGSNSSFAVPLAPPPPPAPPLPASFSSPLSSPWSTLQMPNSSRDDRSRSQMNTTPRQQDKLQQELAQRINDRVGVINQTSTKDEVQRWLISKQISPELAQNLRDMNGEQLFQLTPVALERFANQSEASRLFALLVQQKQLAGYHIDELSDSNNSYPNFGFGSLKSRTPRDVNDSFGLRANDSLSRSLKIKLKQRRDKIEQAETAPETVL